MASSSSTGGAGSPYGASKFLRRKCVVDYIFAPYFYSEEGPSKFDAIHKVFGASNVSKLLHNVPVDDRCDAVVTISYEAKARIKDPVYGCVANIFALEQQLRMRCKLNVVSVIGNTDKSIGIESGDDTLEDAYFDWNNNFIQQQSEDIEGCSKDIVTADLDALVESVVNQKSNNPNIGTSSTVHIHKYHKNDYSSTIPEFAQGELDSILEGLAAPVDDLPLEVIPPSEEIVNQ
ncbi:LOB domain-containing protein 16 [Capsicum chinense]|nr:LOB domain-containing protein 16 [Capsicum chinense]